MFCPLHTLSIWFPPPLISVSCHTYLGKNFTNSWSINMPVVLISFGTIEPNVPWDIIWVATQYATQCRERWYTVIVLYIPLSWTKTISHDTSMQDINSTKPQSPELYVHLILALLIAWRSHKPSEHWWYAQRNTNPQKISTTRTRNTSCIWNRSQHGNSHFRGAQGRAQWLQLLAH